MQHPTKIDVFILALKLISRTVSRAATVIQRFLRVCAKRNRGMRRRLAVGIIVRAWRCHLRRVRETTAATVIQCFLRRKMWLKSLLKSREIDLRFFDACDIDSRTMRFMMSKVEVVTETKSTTSQLQRAWF